MVGVVMSPSTPDSPRDPDDLRRLADDLRRDVAWLRAEVHAKALMIEKLRAQLAVLRRARFGRKSEKLDAQVEQLELLIDDIEAGVAETLARTGVAESDAAEACGVETARAVVVTMDSPSANEAVVETTRSIRRDVTLVARTRDAAHARALYGLGVTDAVPETIEASLQLSEAVLVDLGVPMGLVIASIHEKRDEYRKILVAAGAPERPRSTRRAGRA